MLTDQSREDEEDDVDFTGALRSELDNHNLTGDLMSETD